MRAATFSRKRKGATPHLRIRIEPQLLTRLEKSRTANNRTLTGEIVHRIEQTFRKSDDADLATLVYRAAFGEHTGDLLRAFATAIWLIEKRTGKKWHDDDETAFQVRRAIDQIIDWFTWRRRDPAHDAAFLKYPDLLDLPPVSVEPFSQSLAALHAAANAAALETLQKMGMAPSDAEIDQAATKYRADPKYDEIERARHRVAKAADKAKEIAEIIGEHPNAKEMAKIIAELPNAKEIAKIIGETSKAEEIEEAEIIGELPKTKDEGEGP